MFRATIKKDAIFIYASPEFPMQVFNAGAGKLFHKAEKDVDSGDTELASGSTVEITEGTFFVSTTSAEIVARELKVATVENVAAAGDVTSGDDITVGDKLVVGGEAQIKGELNHDGTKIGFNGSAPVAPSTVKKAALTANELATELAKMGLVKIEA